MPRHSQPRASLLPWRLLILTLLLHLTGAEQTWLPPYSGQATSSSLLHPGSGTDERQTTATAPGTCASAFINYVTRLPPSQCWKQPRPSSSVEAGSSINADPGSTSIGPFATSTPQGAIFSETLSNTSYVAGNPPRTSGQALSSTTSSEANGERTPDATPRPVLDVGSATLVAVEVTTATDEPEPESPLDNAKFLSFEDWKKQNLPQDSQFQKNAKAHGGGQRVRPDFENALEGLGDEGEIVIDFSGFGGISSSGDKQARARDNEQQDGTGSRGPAEQTTDSPKKRSRDAGKTCKERSNYASFDCGATILKTNPQGKSASSILLENKDSYMLNECSADNKFLIVELCDEIKIDTVVLANFEFFSSIFRTFRVSVSDRYPVKIDKWRDIGTFEARNSREMQAFLVENHDGFARFVRIEFLSHYGGEFYCPVSLFRVHGVTAFEEYKLEQLAAEGEDPDEEESPLATIEPTVEELYVATSTAVVSPEIHVSPASTARDEHAKQTIPANQVSEPDVLPSLPEASLAMPSGDAYPAMCTVPIIHGSEHLFASKDSSTCKSDSADYLSDPISTASKPVLTATAVESPIASSSNSATRTSSAAVKDSLALAPSSTSSVFNSAGGSRSSQHSEVSKPVQSLTTSAVAGGSSSNAPASVTGATISSHHASAAAAASSTSSPPTQDSFFKSINKRLQFLEANSTLSLQYIESQSALLREAFAQVEKGQVSKTAAFLNILNTTVSAELSRFQGDYEQLWQSTIMELASQRDEGRRERELLGERVRMLAEEMVSQKRLMAAQATILLLCLGLIVFSRFGGMGSSVDVSFVQAMQEIVHRGKRARAEEREERERGEKGGWQWDSSPWSSPSSRRSKLFSTWSHGEREEELTPDNDRRPDEHQGRAHGFVRFDLGASQGPGDVAEHRGMSHLTVDGKTIGHMTRSAPTTPLSEYPPAARAKLVEEEDVG